MSIATVRAGLAANLSRIADVQVSAYVLSEPTPPTLQIRSGEITYDRAMGRGLDEVAMIVQALVAFSSDGGSQAQLDGLMAPNGATSVKAAVESDLTLGGACDQVHVVSCSGTQLATIAGVAVLMAEWTCIVYMNGAT